MADKNYTTDAINLRSYDLSDADKIIVMYSKDKGLMRSVAKGVKRPKSKLGARMDSLIANTLMFSRGRNLDTICQAQTINPFRKIREDMLKLMFSSYISEIEKISSAIEKKDVIIAVIKFQLKMMLISGIIPEFDTCLCCGKRILNEEMYFSKEHGGVFCIECNSKYHIPLKMHNKIRDFLVAMLQFDFNYESDYDKKATDKICIVCFNLLKEYLTSHSDKKFKSDKVLAEIL